MSKKIFFNRKEALIVSTTLKTKSSAFMLLLKQVQLYLDVSKNMFWNILKNLIYCKILQCSSLNFKCLILHRFLELVPVYELIRGGFSGVYTTCCTSPPSPHPIIGSYKSSLYFILSLFSILSTFDNNPPRKCLKPPLKLIIIMKWNFGQISRRYTPPPT